MCSRCSTYWDCKLRMCAGIQSHFIANWIEKRMKNTNARVTSGLHEFSKWKTSCEVKLKKAHSEIGRLLQTSENHASWNKSIMLPDCAEVKSICFCDGVGNELTTMKYLLVNLLITQADLARTRRSASTLARGCNGSRQVIFAHSTSESSHFQLALAGDEPRGGRRLRWIQQFINCTMCIIIRLERLACPGSDCPSLV